ncbi:MAG: glycosyltransferase [Balneolaceae bacterium]|nr:glycosyltransferase [Balneolaceae bacterium]
MIHSLQAGGMERVTSLLLKSFSKKSQVDLHVILYGIDREIFYTIPDSIHIHKPEFEFNNNQRVWNTFKTLLFVRRKVNKIKPDCILSFGELWNSFVLIALLGVSIPVFITDRCSPLASYSKFHTFLRKYLYPKSEGIIAQTSKMKEFYSELFNHNNIRVIPNPIETRFNLKKEKSEKVILSVGRLIETKHHDRLINIFKNLNAPGWKLIIVGGNALRQDNYSKLSDQIKEYGLEERVKLTGEVKNVDKYYEKADIFAFTSSSEGFPNVIGEAMASGLPIVSYDCVAGPSDLIVDKENGFLISLFDDDDFIKKLQRLIDNRELRERQGTASRELVKKFSLEKVSQHYFEFITNNK